MKFSYYMLFLPNIEEMKYFLQIGRSSESPIDFVVMDTVPGNRPTDKINTQSTISRFACRILSVRDEEDLNAMIFAAGFDSSRNIFLGEKATKWETGENEVDGLTTNGVLVMHPKGTFCPLEGCPDPKPGIWREVSVSSLLLTVWKFQDFSVIQILREINF